jgi:murein DD-endopeptidase MepM/ murein hydrolase activator NlpD
VPDPQQTRLSRELRMPFHLSRSFTLAIVAVAVACSGLANPASALAGTDGFALTYFPNTDVATHFTNDWGDTRSGGRRHQGIDLFGEKHTPIVAVSDGFIIAIGDGDRSGYYVRIEHRDGWESWYMHLNNDTPGTDDGAGGAELAYAPGLRVGMYVAAGTVVGYVGDSGNAEESSSHTHFELHHDGRAVNPYPYLAAAHHRWMRFLELHGEAL